MLDRIRPRLTYANVMVSLLAFVVLGGGAYATHTHKLGSKDIKKNAIKQKQLAPNAVNGPQIRPGVVGTGKLADGAVTGDKIDAGTLGDLRGPSGPQGPRGEPGLQGAKGDRGDLGLQGDVGPTFGFIASVGATPTASPDHPDLASEQTISLPAAGRVFVTGHYGSVEFDCTVGTPRAGLYVNGAPIEGTNRLLENGVSRELDIAGITGQLTAGNHTLRFGFDCPQGNPLGGGSASPLSYTGILLGG